MSRPPPSTHARSQLVVLSTAGGAESLDDSATGEITCTEAPSMSISPTSESWLSKSSFAAL